MSELSRAKPDLIIEAGNRIVTLVEATGDSGALLHPKGSVGVIVKSPTDLTHSYRVRFLDGMEVPLRHDEIVLLAHFKENEIGNTGLITRGSLFDRVIFRCVIGSRAYGLDDEESDTDYRGIFLPTADLHWSLYGVPEQLECHETQEHYWELQRFLVLALKANPNVLECLYSPLVEKVTPLAAELLEMRSIFLSRLVYQTYNGYVLSQFNKMQADLRNHGEVKQKHVMHLIRLLISGINVLRHGLVPVRVEEHREKLLAIKRGQMPWEETERWRLSLHQEFDQALSETSLPDRPDYERANNFLIKARRLALAEELP